VIHTPKLPLAVALAAALALAGCSKPTTGDSTGEPTSTPDDELPTREVVPLVDVAEFQSYQLTLGDLDAYSKGVAFENERLNEAIGKGGAEGMSAFVAALPEQTEPAAAKLVGIDVERYRTVKHRIVDVLAKLATEASRARAADRGPSDDAEVDPSVAAMQAEMDDPYAGLDPDVAQAFKARAARLRALHDANADLLAKAGA